LPGRLPLQSVSDVQRVMPAYRCDTLRGSRELGNERDPLIGNQDGTFDFTIPKRLIRRKITGLPAFTTLKGGAYFFLPGIKALRYLAAQRRCPLSRHQ